MCMEKLPLDIHSVGITAVQMLAELCPSQDDTGLVKDLVLAAVWRLQSAWKRYWAQYVSNHVSLLGRIIWLLELLPFVFLCSPEASIVWSRPVQIKDL